MPTCMAAVLPPGTSMLPGASPAARGGDTPVKRASWPGKSAAVATREDQGGQARIRRGSGCT